ncbi:sensor histidine kinase [Bradyrhizobium sp. LB11.1]|uniref:sensor histidine kinase n=1 Tax=Bradyrhizobium sp. LB11.1 TaxID=3156326 RepID=UPI00339579AD
MEESEMYQQGQDLHGNTICSRIEVDDPTSAEGAAAGDANSEDGALLIAELNHRARNLLAIVEAVIRQTQIRPVKEYRAELLSRLSVLRRCHEMSGPSSTLELAALMEQAIRPYAADRMQVVAAGPDVEVAPSIAVALHLIFHELATNAYKHGSLSSPSGRVEISWESVPCGPNTQQLAIIWAERGGPPVKEPVRRGFGSRLIAGALGAYGRAQLSFDAEGLICRILVDGGDSITDAAPAASS